MRDDRKDVAGKSKKSFYVSMVFSLTNVLLVYEYSKNKAFFIVYFYRPCFFVSHKQRKFRTN